MQVQAQLHTQQTGTGVLRSGPDDVSVGGGLMSSSQQAAQRTAKLVDGAHQFEAMMLQQMLKPLKFGESPDTGPDDDSTDGANKTLQSYGTEALANAISKHGGFGLAQQIIRQVTAEDARNTQGADPQAARKG